MNILYLCTHLNAGGITSYLVSLAKGMKKLGHNVYIASGSSADTPAARILKQEGAVLLYLPVNTKSELSFKIILSLLRLKDIIRRYGIDIIHSHSRVTQVLGELCSRIYPVAYVSTCHGFFRARIFRRMFGCWGKKVIAISPEVKKHLIFDLGVDEKKISVIFSGIDAGRFAPLGMADRLKRKQKFGLNPEFLTVGIVARLSREKGHTYLIGAMRSVVKSFSGVQLLIVGEGRLKKELVDLARKAGICSHTVFIDSIVDTAQIISVIDVFVLPSLKEGLGLALMEAMASASAVVGSDVGGIKSLIRHGYNGLLVEPADSMALAAEILGLLNNPAKRKLLGDTARNYIIENFPLENMVRQTGKVYLSCAR